MRIRTLTARQGWVLALPPVASLMVALDQLVVATALSTVRDDLGASIETLEWTVNAYSLSFAVLLIAGAAMGDRFGRRRVFVARLARLRRRRAATGADPSERLSRRRPLRPADTAAG